MTHAVVEIHPIELIDSELSSVASALASDGAPGIEAVADALGDARRVFVLGAGRSGLALQMTGMRLMHLGLSVHVVGDSTTPAIGEGDVLLVASGSGTTGTIVRAAASARKAGAAVAVITAAPDAPVAEGATAVITVPAAGKLDRSGSISAQYAGSLFEQSVVLVGDAIFHLLWTRSGASADDLWPRHANLE
ncbi:MAG TPA: 6-phospho-3-hexuloisomerase [Microbacterium sp.]|nr:6-phospho-3-hexuloisomerase [Microbacterium sp.]